MPLILSEVLLSDLPEVHRLALSADQQSATAELLFPNGPSEASITHLVKQDEKDMRDLSSTSRHVIIRDLPGDVQGKGEVVSYALWNFFVGRGKETTEQSNNGGGGDGAYYESWPPDANQEALGALVEMGRRKREGIMAQENYAFLASLCTAPTHRRLGAASQLVEWGLALADAHRLPSYVESTPGGLQFYLKHGFEKVDTMEIDLRPWGRNHVQEHAILLRPVKQPSIPADQIIIAPVLTNSDFFSFRGIEHAVFLPGNPTPGSLLTEPSKKPFSVFALITRNTHETGILPQTLALVENSITDYTSHYIKAIQPGTNTIIGWAIWNICSTPSLRPQRIPFPKGANEELIDAFYGKLHRAEDEYMKGKPNILMHRLAVLPEWQGKGVGKRLLEWGNKKADKKSLDCWVDASGAALGFFEKFGWKQVGAVEVDLADWGGEEGKKERVVQCIRMPRGQDA